MQDMENKSFHSMMHQHNLHSLYIIKVSVFFMQYNYSELLFPTLFCHRKVTNVEI